MKHVNKDNQPPRDPRKGDTRGLVVELLGKRALQSVTIEYLVRRGGEPLEQARWELEDDLKNSVGTKDMIATFEEDYMADLARCAVCNEGTSLDVNAIMLCDGCDLPVHQQCYGVTEIPEGDWFCNPCAAGMKPTEVECSLCPFKGGA